MSEIQAVHTPCKQCVFATYDNITQIGCALNYLDKYRFNNIDILEAYDEDKEFYVINGKKCLGYRENKWFEQFDLQNSSLEDKIAKYNETNSLNYTAIMNLQVLSHDEFDSLCQQLANCTIKPKRLVLIRYRDDELSFAYDLIDQILKKHNISCVWRIQTMLDNTIIYENAVHNIVQHDRGSRFALSLNGYSEDLIKIVETVNTKVYKELDSFILGGNKDKSAMIYSISVYKYGVANNEDITLNDELYTII